MKKIFTLITLVLLFSTLISGCAKAPEEEMEEAQKFFEKAVEVEADAYAQDEYAKSKELLSKAQQAVNNKKYDDAKRLALDATEASKKAIEVAKVNFEKAQFEAEELVNIADNQVREYVTAHKKDKNLAKKIEQIKNASEEAKAAFESKKFKNAIEKATLALDLMKDDAEK